MAVRCVWRRARKRVPAMAQQSAARRAERAAARAAEAEAEEDYDEAEDEYRDRKVPKRRWKLRLSASVCRTG